MSTSRAKADKPVDVWGNDGPAVTSPRTFESVGDGQRYVMTLADVPISIEFDRPHWEHHDLHGQLTVKTGLTGARTFRGILSVGTYNCSSPTTRQSRAKQCEELSKAPQIDWHRLLHEFSIRVLEAEASGQPAVDLRTVARADAADAIDILGIRILERHPILLFGDGGTFKSYLGLYIAGQLAARGLSVMYADWELDASDHRERLERLFVADMPLIHYVRCNRPLSAEVDRLQRLATELEAAYLICDSVVFACDGPPEAAEVAQRYFQCIRRIGIGSLHLAHTNKSEESDKKPFGSAFWHNGARATWNVKLSTEPTIGTSEIALGFYNRKSNLGPLLPAVGLGVSFTYDQTLIRPVSLAERGGDLAAELPIWQRMQRALVKPQTLAALAEEIGAKVDSIEKTVKRKSDLFTRVAGPDGVARIALVSRLSA